MNGRADRAQVLIAGGGVAALEATLALRALAEERVAITLVAPESDFTYRPLAVAEPFRVGDVRRFPLGPLVEAAGAVLQRGRVAAVVFFVRARKPDDNLLAGVSTRRLVQVRVG